MAEIGQRAHEDLLAAGLHPNKDEREEVIWDILKDFKIGARLKERVKESLGKPIEEELVEPTLKESTIRSATGVNGIPYEFWKVLHKTKQEDKN